MRKETPKEKVNRYRGIIESRTKLLVFLASVIVLNIVIDVLNWTL